MNNNKYQLSITTALEGLYAVTVTSVNSTCSKVSGNFQVTIVPTPVFTFNYPDVIKKCPGETQSLEVLAAGSYKYRWYKNNELNGEQGSTLNVTGGGKYRVELSACDESWVTSKDVQVDFVELPQPVVSSNKPSYCAGDTAILKLNMIAHDSYTIDWYKGDQLLSDYRNNTNIIIMEGGAYSVNIEGTGAACAKISNQLIITFDPQPVFTIQRTVNSTLCDGQDVELKVSNNAGDVKWSTGESSEQILVRSSGIYSATITTPGGCATSQQMSINFYPLPRLNLSNVSLCTYKHESAIITAPPGFVKYLWNNRPGTNAFMVTEPQTVSLTVTDTNGCQASQEIKVINTCIPIKIPNTFTPNGDGINDNWNIEGLENDSDAEVRVFSRYGTKVYESHGYPKPWDATFLGKKLPAGVYYYLIGTKLSVQRFSGSLTIIY
ncbi:gliding motility-associated C-terminal domain-containing protein [Mucilaginibacter sp. L3T2-6]|uniref:gliding motility-associated C-terminal domain-containing protein n=1 Tax=Mucilaginibacter sp. L3T2-6 TaxID=3062491 RepID=UPI002674BD00|nr:gliding motility-associated C-terminal domain-containing protein [Mucilaginibacter sp. L3T2-6]MDO3645229.1 gliding motility-associated C-terminal domain-containing protein [Mucilaginibacter sp. L3T2-6]MDV6217681.1 gliding motility-associated C-terminal domain-containing protein [Mucilaginibacter sp. L3T2-6]